MGEGALLKYGMIKNEETAVCVPAPMGASEVIAVKSGRFVTNDGSGRMEMADDGSTLLAGWVELPETKNYNASGIYTCSSTEGADIAKFYPIGGLLGVVFRIPISEGATAGAGTYVATMLGETCDLEIKSNIQGAQLDASAEDTLIIVGGDLVNNAWVDVMVNPDKITGLTGVA